MVHFDQSECERSVCELDLASVDGGGDPTDIARTCICTPISFTDPSQVVVHELFFEDEVSEPWRLKRSTALAGAEDTGCCSWRRRR